LVSVLVGSAVLLAIAGPAAADPWGTGSDGTGTHPDSDPHTFCYSEYQVAEGAKPNIREAEWNALDPTQANVDFTSSCDFYGGTETDVVWHTGALSGDTQGYYFCEDFDTYCDQAYTYLDLAEINEGPWDEADQSQTACHELGHTAGLTHGGNSEDCMVNGLPNDEVQWQRYGSHHEDHINNWF
jgi:hypothetical protein